MAERKIGTRTFKTEPLLATQAIMLQARVFKLIGPGLSKIGQIMANSGGEGEQGRAALGALAEVFAQADPEAVTALVRDVVQMAQIKRPSGIYENCDMDGDFTGHAADVYPVALFVLKEQLGDFFSGLPELGSLKKLGQA